jgi:hypothetical protein
VVRGPNEWPAAQRALHEAIDGGAAMPRRPVRVVWWTAAPLYDPDAWGVKFEAWVAVYEPEGAAGEALMVLPVADQLDGAGTTPATLLGEVGMNAACAVELADGRTVWPRYNPVVGRWAPQPDTLAVTSRCRWLPGSLAVTSRRPWLPGSLAVPSRRSLPGSLALLVWGLALAVVAKALRNLGLSLPPAVFTGLVAAGIVVIPLVTTRRRVRRR